MSQNPRVVDAETPWLTVEQAALYCKCSKRAFLLIARCRQEWLYIKGFAVAKVQEMTLFCTVDGTVGTVAADWPIKAKGGWRGRRYRK